MIYFWKQCKRRRRSSYTCSHIYFLSTVKSHYVTTLRMQEFLFSSKFICSRPANSGRAQTIATLSQRDFELGSLAVGSARAHIELGSVCYRLEVGGSLELGSLAAIPLNAQACLCFFPPFPSSPTLSPRLVFLPWRRRLGDRRRHSSRRRPALCRRRASAR